MTAEGARVLVIEDEALVGMLLEDMLQDIGCQRIELVPRFDEAMQAAEEGDYDLAVLDVNLDGTNSFPHRRATACPQDSTDFRDRLRFGRDGSALRGDPDLAETFLLR